MKHTPLRRVLLGRLTWLLACALSVLLGLADWSPIKRLDLAAYDTLEPSFRAAALPAASAVLAIDERTISALGRWPWHRDVHSEVVERLSAAGAAAVGMPILFAETSPGDEQFAATLARSGKVVLAVAPRAPDPGSPEVFEILPTPVLADAAAALGHVDVELDADALTRRIYLRAGSGGPSWEALALATLHLARGAPQFEPKFSRQGATHEAPLTSAASGWHRQDGVLLPYPDAHSAPRTLSYLDLYQQPELARTLAGHAVFIGVTAAGLDAGLITPASSLGQPMAAVEFHARAFEALRSGLTYHTATPALTVGLSLLLLLIPTVLFPHLRTGAAIAFGSLILVPPLVSGMAIGLLQLWIPPTAAMIAFLAGYLGWFGALLSKTLGSLRHARRHATATLCSITDAVITVDGDKRVVFMNPVAERLAGLRLAESKGRLVDEVLGQFTDQTENVSSALSVCLQLGESQRLPDPIHWRSPEGRQRALQLTVAPIGEGGGGEGAVLAFNDLTEILEAGARLRHEATHDAMTGLPNRSLLLERLDHALLQAQRSGEMVAILFVDLDRFKRINDSLGHHAGDAALRIVADRLVSSIRQGDTVSRWGGDEFIILMESLKDRFAVVSVAEKIIGIAEQEFSIDKQSNLVLSCCIGIAIAPQDGTDAQTLLSVADQAMYSGKLEGGGSYNFYAAEMNNWSRDRLELEGALRQALLQGQFELYYQPQIDIANGQLVGMEALIRWHQPGVGLISPGAFIPTAEESGIIRAIGDWVIQEAVGQASRWQAEGLTVVPIAINLSARQCVDTSVENTLRTALHDHKLDAALVKIELTESIAMNTTGRTADLMHNINQLGIDIELDDFGTGYSSLSLLRRFQISQLKIDRTFVDAIAADSDDAAIVRGTIALAHGLGMTVVAEGVETERQLCFLAQHQCDKAQGYLFSPPRPASEMRAWLIALPPHAIQALASLRSSPTSTLGH
ncbi:MAG: EAL domain-containing protein [Azoarcus sp.]|nr:EAL domain-containing protein [Azoarcus sp.]